MKKNIEKENDEKHFNVWMGVKDNLHRTNRIRTIHEGEVWWTSIGENVGTEINGKK